MSLHVVHSDPSDRSSQEKQVLEFQPVPGRKGCVEERAGLSKVLA